MANASQLFKDDEQERLGNGYVPESNELSKAAGEDKDQSKSLSAGGLAQAESNIAATAASLFNPAGGISGAAKASKYLLQNRRKAAAGGGIVGLIIGAVFLIFMALIPLKIENMVQNLQKRFFSTSENAIQTETQTLFETYMVKNVFPGYKSCGGVIKSTCRAINIGTGNNPVTNLYRAWANSKLETKLATNYGIEFSYDRNKGIWSLKGPSTSSTGDILDKNLTVANLDSEFKRSDRAGMRSAVKDAIKNETKWTQVFYRYKVGRLLEQKYGIKRCIVFCGTKDALSDFKTSKKNAAKIYIAQRVLTPLSTSRGVVLQCVIDPNCDPGKASDSSNNSSKSSELNGSPESSLDSNVRKNLVDLATHYGITDSKAVQGLIDEYAKIGDAGFQKYALTAVLEKIGLSAVSSQAADAIPVAGWVIAGSNVIHFVNNSGPAIKKIAYASNAAAAVSLYMTYRTYADEIHTGNVDATELGSFVSTLGSGDNGTVSDPQVGGTASAEATPLYGYLMNGTTNTQSSVSFLDSLIPAKAYADSTGKSSYTCSDGKSVPTNKIVCGEEVLGQGNGLFDAAHSFLNAPGLGSVTSVADTISKLSGALSSLVGKLVNILPFVKDISQLVSNFMAPFINKIVQLIVPTPFSSNMSGGRTFDMMAAGADVAGNDTAHTTIGGRRLNATDVASIVSQQQQSDKQSFMNKSFFAKMFDTSTSYSLVSKVAMDIPFNFQSSLGNSVASIISSPFSALLHGFGALFSTSSASAAVAPLDDPFKIPQYGYTSTDLANIGDPEAYWNANCTDNAAQGYQQSNKWNSDAAVTIDDATGSFVNTDTNPCLLIKTVVGSAGAVYDTSLLSSGEL